MDKDIGTNSGSNDYEGETLSDVRGKSGGGGQRTGGRRLQGMSPEETKEYVKEAVRKGVAAVAGAVEGFAGEVKENDLPEYTKQAIELAGETTRTVVETTKEEALKVKDAVTGGGQGGLQGSRSTGLQGGALGASRGFGGSGGSSGRQGGGEGRLGRRGSSDREGSREGGGLGGSATHSE